MKRIMLTALITLAMSCTVLAEEEYLVKLKTGGISLFSVEQNINKDMEYVADGLYSTDKENAEKLLRSGRAEFIEPDSPLEAYDIVPNDPYYGQQVYMQYMKIPEIQKVYSGRVRIGVIDSGINAAHPDLAGADIAEGYNYVDNSTDTDDTYNHGTRVAGVLVSRPNNGIGTAGVVPDGTIVPLVTMMTKTVDGKETKVGNLSHLIRAINGAVNDYDCKVLNISLGTSDYSKNLEAAVNNAVKKGVIIIAAAGNDGAGSEGVYNYPASFDTVISVGAVTENYSLASYSQRNDKIDVSAVYSSSYLPNNSGSYSRGAGTSFAAPVITGIVSLIVSDNPEFDFYAIKQIITAASADVCGSGKDYSGYGVLMCDEIEHVRNYRHSVFISPYIKDGLSYDIKLLSDNSDSEAILVKAIYEDDKFKSFTYEPITYDSDGVAWAEAEAGENEELRLFVWNSLEGQQSLSDVR